MPGKEPIEDRVRIALAWLLSAFVEPPERVTSAQMDRWRVEFDNWGHVIGGWRGETAPRAAAQKDPGILVVKNCAAGQAAPAARAR